MPSGIFKHIPRHIALLAAAAIPLALATGIIVTLYFGTPSSTQPSALIASIPQPSVLTPQPLPLPVPSITPPLRLDPFDVLAHANAPDPALKAWLDSWQTLWSAGKDPDAKQIAELEAVLEKSPLGAEDLLALAHAFHHLSDDGLTSARIYNAASLHVESQLNRQSLTVDESLPALLAINQHMDDYKSVFWPLIEKQGRREYAKSLYRIYSNFVRLAPATGDINLVKASRHPAIGAAECLYVLGHQDEAISRLESMSKDEMTAGEKIGWSWIYGLTLLAKGRYAEAIPHLQLVAASPDFKYAGDAIQPLVEALSNVNRITEAEALFKTWATHGPADMSASIRMDAAIKHAKARTEHPNLIK